MNRWVVLIESALWCFFLCVYPWQKLVWKIGSWNQTILPTTSPVSLPAVLFVGFLEMSCSSSCTIFLNCTNQKNIFRSWKIHQTTKKKKTHTRPHQMTTVSNGAPLTTTFWTRTKYTKSSPKLPKVYGLGNVDHLHHLWMLYSSHPTPCTSNTTSSSGVTCNLVFVVLHRFGGTKTGGNTWEYPRWNLKLLFGIRMAFACGSFK